MNNLLLQNLMQKIPFYKLKFKKNILSMKFSRYKPHQGEQEKTRRRKQIEKGVIKI